MPIEVSPSIRASTRLWRMSVSNRSQFLDGFVGPPQEALDHIRLAAQLFEGVLQLSRGFGDLRARPLIGLVPVIARPEDRDSFHKSPLEIRGQGLAVRGQIPD